MSSSSLRSIIKNRSLVYDACVCGKVDALERNLLENNIDINKCEINGKTPLMVAVQCNKVEVVKFILKFGGDINLKCRKGDSALAIAIFNCCPELVTILLEHKANVLNINENGESALMWALNRREFWKRDATNKNGVQKIQYFWPVKNFTYEVINFENTESSAQKVLDLILEYLLTSNDQEYITYYKFCQAVIKNDIEDVKRQLREIKDIKFSKVKAESPLAFAVASNQLEMAKVLLDSGMSSQSDANLNRQSLFLTWLWSSEWNKGCVEMLELLLTSKVELENGVLHAACKNKFWPCVSLLIMKSADVNSYDETGETPFHIACRTAKVEVLKAMVEHGANLLKKNISYKTVLHFAAENIHFDSFFYIFNLVIGQGLLDVNERDVMGCTPLHAATDFCDNYYLLLKNGADINIDSECNCRSGHYHRDPNERNRCQVYSYLDKLEILGYNLSRCKFTDMDPSLLNLCLQELEKLKNSVISWSPRATLHSFLFMKRNQAARFSANKNLERIFKDCGEDFETKYPCYGSVLNVQYRRGRNRTDLLDFGKASLAEVFGTRIHENAGEFILEFLNNSELKSFGNIKWDSL